MAEAVATIGLIASIVQLADFGSRLIVRMNDFATSTKDVPQTFINISVQLPLAISTLQRLRSRLETNEFPEDETPGLKALVDHSLTLVRAIGEILQKLMPPKSSSSLEKRLAAIHSLRHDKKLNELSSQLLQNINLLAFFNSTQSKPSGSNVTNKAEMAAFPLQSSPDFQYGLNLGIAPRLEEGGFVGRESELFQLADMMKSSYGRQCVVAVVGTGGMGKTQLCIEYAIRNQAQYSFIYWVNAQDSSSLKADWLAMTHVIFPDDTDNTTDHANETTAIQKIRRWLSRPDNQRWLLIFDNLDNPKMPGGNDATSVDIQQYFPHRSQGSILINTRSRKIGFAKQMHLEKLEDVTKGMEILSARSGRNLNEDQSAIELVRRLDGLPLALASAASFLERTSCTVEEYLGEYDKMWLMGDLDNLYEYGDRTLFTTWDISYERLKLQSPEAARILRLLAFFGNENIEYELLAPHGSRPWPGVGSSLQTKTSFHHAMGKLRDYSLVEISHKCYRLHPCVHDWTRWHLNQNIEEEDVWLAMERLQFYIASRSSIWSNNYDENLSRLASHALRTTQPDMQNVLMHSKLDESRAAALDSVGHVLQRAEFYDKAEKFVSTSLEWTMLHLGPDHKRSLYAANNLGQIYDCLGDFSRAERFYKQSCSGWERVAGLNDRRTIDPVHNLALLYTKQERFDDAEKMYLWSMHGSEESYGMQDPNTFWAATTLASFYLRVGKLDLAEKSCIRALNGFTATIDPDHHFIRSTESQLGQIYQRQERLSLAETMFQRAYDAFLRIDGPDHWLTKTAEADLRWIRIKAIIASSPTNTMHPKCIRHRKCLQHQATFETGKSV